MPLEKDIAKEFTKIFKQYSLYIPNNTTESGWPDRLIQTPNSVIVACELKRVFVILQNYYLLSDLRQEQCAWLAKWQRSGGKCFVLVGVIRFDLLVGYHCITQSNWSNWLLANKSRYTGQGMRTSSEVLVWFKEYIGA
jgi:hypothetical protein